MQIEQHNTNSPVLFLSSVMPEERAVGGVVLEDMCKLIPREQLVAHLLFNNRRLHDGELQAQDQKLGKKYFQDSQTTRRRFEWPLQTGTGRLKRYYHILRRKIASTVYKRRLVRKAVAFGRKHNVQAVWSMLNLPLITEITLPIMKALNVPLHSLIWDDPEYLASEMGLDRLGRNDFLTAFEKTMRASKSVAVCGESMAAEYSQKFGANCIVVRHAVDKSLWKPIHEHEKVAQKQFLIGYCGSVSAPEAMESFLAALDSIHWKIAGKDVVVRLSGSSFQLKGAVPRRIEYVGWGTMENTINMLHGCDINYMPQPFLPKLKRLMQLSFPNKLSTYLAAGRPIFLHGPKECSIGKFSETFPCVEWCKTDQKENILKSLTRLATDQSLMNRLAKEVERARETEINAGVFQKRFTQFLA